MGDYLLWYGRNRECTKVNPVYEPQDIELGTLAAGWLLTPNGEFRGVTRDEVNGIVPLPEGSKLYKPDNIQSQGGANEPQPFEFQGKRYEPASNNHWKPNYPAGLENLAKAGRLHIAKNSIQYRRFADDFPLKARGNLWTDTLTGSFTDAKQYVVQTSPKVVERCLLMTTDPGDLVLDPTCGSGTTAFVAEKWGRRWITCDTSRVAVTLAKQRLVTASYDYFALKYPHEGLKGGFIYKTVPHVTLKSIANNPEIDEIYERMHPAVEKALGELNEAFAPPSQPPPAGGRSLNTLPEGEMSNSPLTQRGRVREGELLQEWAVPFDFPTDWPEAARAPFDAFHKARQTMQKQMDASIAAHADQETLFDQPQPDKKKLRITGPFTVEAVPFPTVLALDEAQPAHEADVAIARSGESARQHQWRDELLTETIRRQFRGQYI